MCRSFTQFNSVAVDAVGILWGFYIGRVSSTPFVVTRWGTRT